MSSAAQAVPDSRRDEILSAALAIFTHYGFRRASLEQIAREAGISRTGLYHHFASKEEIFRAMAERMHEVAMDAAGAQAASKGSAEQRLLGVLRAKLGFFFDRLAEARHGIELLDQSNRLCGDMIAEVSGRYVKLVAKVLREADRNGELSLQRARLTADSAALLLTHSGYGLQGQPGGETPTPAQYDKRLQELVRVFVSGVEPRLASDR